MTEQATAKRVWTRDEINALLLSSNEAVEKGIVRLYERQTSDEQSQQTTKHLNGRGFSGAQANHGSYYARWILSGKHLSGKHLIRARKICLQHSKQLVEVANA